MIEFKPFAKMPRLSRDCTITEKIDGTNSSIYIVHRGEINWDTTDVPEPYIIAADGDFLMFAGSRTKWITPGKGDNYGFAGWVRDNATELFKMGPGQHFGEWWGSKIQRGYGLTDGKRYFSLFNTDRWNTENKPECCKIVPIIRQGLFTSQLVEEAVQTLREQGSFAMPGFNQPEGVVCWHMAANMGFKKTLEKDESPKGLITS